MKCVWGVFFVAAVHGESDVEQQAVNLLQSNVQIKKLGVGPEGNVELAREDGHMNGETGETGTDEALLSIGLKEGVVGQETSLGLGDFTKDNWISSHNNFRSQHNACGLSWSTVLATNAQQVAQSNANANQLAHSDSYSNSPSSGENLAMGYTTPSAVTRGWHGEVADCDWSKSCETSTNGNAVGHFTAMVWKSSTLVGCGAAEAQCSWGPCMYSACHYASSAPNMGGEYPANVEKKSSAVPQCGGSNPPASNPSRRRASTSTTTTGGGGGGSCPSAAGGWSAPCPVFCSGQGWSAGWSSVTGTKCTCSDGTICTSAASLMEVNMTGLSYVEMKAHGAEH